MKRLIVLLLVCGWFTEAFAQQPNPGKPGNPSAPAKEAGPGAKGKGKGKGQQEDPAKREKAIRTLCERLQIGEGAVVAEIGCGKGAETMQLAAVVGASGKVYGEEITQGSVDALKEKLKNERRDNVVPVLGNSKDPCLPDGTFDLIYMHRVFHHFADPWSMLSQFRRDLKPGGRLAIADRERGPQREWPEMPSREKTHAWTGETTVVRMAREAGFEFETEFDDFWPEAKMFVLVFRRPEGAGEGKPGDPELPLSLDPKGVAAELPKVGSDNPNLLFLGIDRGRALLPALREMAGAGGSVRDVLIEEWRTFKEDLPPDVKDEAADVARTAQGDLPDLAKNSLDAAIFADGYSRLWDPAPLLRRIREALKPGGYVAILDRSGPDEERRTLANHRRRIASARVKSEMRAAGFECVKELPAPAGDRFFLLFQPRKS